MSDLEENVDVYKIKHRYFVEDEHDTEFQTSLSGEKSLDFYVRPQWVGSLAVTRLLCGLGHMTEPLSVTICCLNGCFLWNPGKGVCHFMSIARLRDVVPKHPTRVAQNKCSINDKIIFKNLLNASVSLYMFTCYLMHLTYSPSSFKTAAQGTRPSVKTFWLSLQLSFFADILMPPSEP